MAILHSALFIDYDNVRSELDRYDPAIAARFSNKTLLWLEALEKELRLPDGVEADGRRIVSRRCYASPYQINNYRRNFTQTGFEVIDCPPLTTHLKNSADIYIVMDIVDYLARYPHIDEYIILSADADFVPVLNRLRKELKKSVIFTSYNTTSAYRNCSDRTIEADFFAQYLALETSATLGGQAIAPIEAGVPRGAPVLKQPDGASADLSAAIEACLKKAAARRLGRLPFATAASAIRDELRTLLGDNWAGYRTFRALLENVALAGLEVDWDGQEISIPNFTLELPNWNEEDRDRLIHFVTSVLTTTSKHIPILRPSDYSLIFDALAAYYQDEPQTFTDAIASVTETCVEQGVTVTASEVRFIATGISMQQYRFDEGADATHLASLWRMQIFDLCGEPDWMRGPEDAELFAEWIHATGESVAEARDDFLARTADDFSEGGAEAGG